MHGMVNIAVRAARRAGELMIRQLNRLETLEITEKNLNDYVTEVDYRAEEAIIEVIYDHYPDHSILAEERGQQGNHEFQWIIDPLDGTTNFIHGFPVFAVSIAVTHNGQLEHGVVYDPLRQEIFTASRGQGAQVDGRKIRVSRCHNMRHSLIATGFPYRGNKQHLDDYLAMLKSVIGILRHQATRVGRAGPVLRGCRACRWLLGAWPRHLGHRGRRPDDQRGRRSHQRLSGYRRVPAQR